jgi:ABC-type enterochelin transport system substrate-binding protein
MTLDDTNVKWIHESLERIEANIDKIFDKCEEHNTAINNLKTEVAVIKTKASLTAVLISTAGSAVAVMVAFLVAMFRRM